MNAFAAESPLVGTWLVENGLKAVLKADGTGVVRGDAVHWKAEGKMLTLAYDEDGRLEVMAYKVAPNSLTISGGGESATYQREGAAAKAEKAPKAEKAGKDELSKLLQSSPWCYFRYNQISGSSHQERAVFHGDGRWSSGARGESYSSGAYGTVAGQTDSSAGGRWQAKGGRLLMSEGGGPLQDTGLQVTQNSNGYPILKSEGKEWSQCR